MPAFSFFLKAVEIARAVNKGLVDAVDVDILRRDVVQVNGEDQRRDALILRQRGIMLRDIVDKLKPRYSRIVKMRYFEEMTYEEIAQELNIPLGTVKIQLRRARMLLAEIIKSQKESL